MKYLVVFLLALFAFQVLHCQETGIEVEVPGEEESAVGESQTEVDVEENESAVGEAQTEDVGEEESAVGEAQTEEDAGESAVGSAVGVWDIETWLQDEEKVKISDFGSQWVIADQIGNRYIENTLWAVTLDDFINEEFDNKYNNYTFTATMTKSGSDETFKASFIVSVSPANGVKYWIPSYSAYLSNQRGAPSDDALLRVSWKNGNLTYGEDFVNPDDLSPIDPEGQSFTNNWDKLPQAEWLANTDLQVEANSVGLNAINQFKDQGIIDKDLTWNVDYVYPYSWVDGDTTYWRFDFGVKDEGKTLSGWGEFFIIEDANGGYTYVTAGLSQIIMLDVLYPNN